MKIGSVAARVAVISAVSMILGFGLCTVTLITTQGANNGGELAAGRVGAALLLFLGAAGLLVALVMAIVASLRTVEIDPGPRMPFPPASPSISGATPPPPSMVAPPPFPKDDGIETDRV